MIPATIATRTAAPAPIAIFFQSFIVFPATVLGFPPVAPLRERDRRSLFEQLLAESTEHSTGFSAGMTRSHSGIRSCRQESSNLKWTAKTLGAGEWSRPVMLKLWPDGIISCHRPCGNIRRYYLGGRATRRQICRVQGNGCKCPLNPFF